MDVRRTHSIVGALRASRRPALASASSSGATEYLIQDPHHEYAARFIEHLYRTYGYRAVCFYSDRRERLFHRPHFPVLGSECVAASYDVGTRDLANFAAHVAANHHVTAVVPFNEPTVAPAVELARLLQLDWAQPDVMRRFHDKFALKDYIRTHHPDVHMNASRRVTTVKDVLDARRDPAYGRFVLKPNNGFGNRNIGLFDETTDAAALEAFLGRLQGTPVVMEQYIDGTEYFVNGQVDAVGDVCVVALFEYVRRPANGRHNIDTETLTVPYRDPRFAQLASYAQQVIRATQLRRSPFHLELKASPGGPCLIEVGARLAGHGNAFLNEQLHGSRLNVFGLAAHYYFKSEDYGAIPLDWGAYDSTAFRYVHGVAARQTRIYRLEGIREVESLPEFHGWVKKPRLGMPLQPTSDMLSMPYSLLLKGNSQDRLALTASQVRETLKLNRSVGIARRTIVTAVAQARRYARSARVRLASLASAPEGVIEPLSAGISFNTLARRSRRLIAQTLRRIGRKAQLLGVTPGGGSPRYTAASDSTARSDAIVRWAREYLGRPHSRLGRPGAICPFVRKTIDLERFLVRYYDEVDGADLHALRDAVLREARAFRNAYPRSGPDGLLASVVLVFPRLTEANFVVLDQLHDELKTHLIAQHELMSSPFHPRSVKPSISNPEFAVFRAPLPMLAIRHMDVRDIAFIATNKAAFKRYRHTFVEQFARDEVSNEFGHARAYREACRRFGLDEVAPEDQSRLRCSTSQN